MFLALGNQPATTSATITFYVNIRASNEGYPKVLEDYTITKKVPTLLRPRSEIGTPRS